MPIDGRSLHHGHISSCIYLKISSGGNDELCNCQYCMELVKLVGSSREISCFLIASSSVFLWSLYFGHTKIKCSTVLSTEHASH